MAELLLPGQGLGTAAPAGSLELQVPAAGNGWQKVVGRFRAGSSSTGAQLALTFEGPGILLVDMVSMFPAGAARLLLLLPAAMGLTLYCRVQLAALSLGTAQVGPRCCCGGSPHAPCCLGHERALEDAACRVHWQHSAWPHRISPDMPTLHALTCPDKPMSHTAHIIRPHPSGPDEPLALPARPAGGPQGAAAALCALPWRLLHRGQRL
jgi:hypothetical protein